jgi:HSP20 family molecular chaperone IbpA
MGKQSALMKREKNAVVRLVPADLLVHRRNEIDGMIALRAYELFEAHGRLHGHDVADWLQAEDEILHTCRHDLNEFAEAIILRAELPSSYPAVDLCVSVEPRRVLISGEKTFDVGYQNGGMTRAEWRRQRIYRAHELSVEVNPSVSTAIVRGDTLEVIMPKTIAPRKLEARSASSAG